MHVDFRCLEISIGASTGGGAIDRSSRIRRKPIRACVNVTVNQLALALFEQKEVLFDPLYEFAELEALPGLERLKEELVELLATERVVQLKEKLLKLAHLYRLPLADFRIVTHFRIQHFEEKAHLLHMDVWLFPFDRLGLGVELEAPGALTMRKTVI